MRTEVKGRGDPIQPSDYRLERTPGMRQDFQSRAVWLPRPTAASSVFAVEINAKASTVSSMTLRPRAQQEQRRKG